VAMLVVVMDRDDGRALLTPSHLAALGRLGVDSVGLVGDERTLAVVVEGWAFDPVRTANAAHTALGADREVQTLYQLAHVAVSTATWPHERKWSK
jgi:hypothetical protein